MMKSLKMTMKLRLSQGFPDSGLTKPTFTSLKVS